MRITEQQLAILKGLTCERLSSNPDNLRLVDDFFNRRNESLVHTLQNEAMEEDEEGSCAYYVIKDKNDQILFFFSLKNGSLYDKHLDAKTVQFLQKLNQILGERLASSNLTDEEKASYVEIQEKVRSKKGLSIKDLDKLPRLKTELLEDLEYEFNNNVTHVGKTYSAIELVHFCSNDKYEYVWKDFGFPRNRGSIIFWFYVAPIITSVQSFIGLQYLYLFAADLSKEKKLVKYYQDSLSFKTDNERTTAKPLYDLSCKFMYQETKDLADRRQLFFDNFNDEDNSVL